MRLVILSDDKLLVDFEYKDGQTAVNYICDNIKNDAGRWINYGLSEWIDDDGDEIGVLPSGEILRGKKPRFTTSSHPEFLSRLKDYLQRQFNTFKYFYGERFMIELTQKFEDRDWFHSVGNDQYGRVVVYVKYMCHETLHDILDRTSDGKQILVHFAGYLLAKREDFTDNGIPKQEVSELNNTINMLVADLGKEKVSAIFYEIHDGNNAVTHLSDKHPYVRESLEKLYDEYGFDVLFDLLDE